MTGDEKPEVNVSQKCARTRTLQTTIPLDFRQSPQHSMGGTFTMTFGGDAPLKEIEFYNLIYHVLRGISKKKLRVPTQSTAQVGDFLKSWREIKEMLVQNEPYLGGLRLGTLISSRTVDDVVDLYMQNEVFKINTYLLPSRLVMHRISVQDYLASVDRLYNRATARLRTLGAMSGHQRTIPITQDMKNVMGDLKSLIGYSVLKTPHTHHSYPHAWWKRRVAAAIPEPPPQQIPPPRDGPIRRGSRFNDEMDQMIVRLAIRMRNARTQRISWKNVHQRFNTIYPHVATKIQLQDRHKTLTRNGCAQTILSAR